MKRDPHFGEFLRRRRTALGLKLREFCRRNGLDSGNLSRIERGLVKPPQSSDALAQLARALQFAPESEDWARFHDLAAVASGRVPKLIEQDRLLGEKLPELYRELRRVRRQRSPMAVSATDLEVWADRIDSRSELPRLVRRLIHATCPSVERIEFPAGEGSERPGFDGRVLARGGSAFVPAGLSVWELGAGKRPLGKADDDYTKRLNSPAGVNPNESTFIFVTPRRWHDKSDWEQAKNDMGPWKEVRVYDADTLEEWLEQAPAVERWFAAELGKRPAGSMTADEHWRNLRSLTVPPLDPRVFLVSRDEEAKRLDDWLRGPPSELIVVAASATETVDFVAARIASMDDHAWEAVSSQFLFVESLAEWEQLAAQERPLALVAGPGLNVDRERVVAALRNQHRVLLHGLGPEASLSGGLLLPRVDVYQLRDALVLSGFDEVRADQASRECHGCLTVLKRRLSHVQGSAHPAWAAGPLATSLSSTVLLGRWVENNPADRSVLEQISGLRYNEVATQVAEAAATPDPVVTHLPFGWCLSSREDSWFFLAHLLPKTMLDRWEQAVIGVLAQVDPAFRLPSDQRVWSVPQEQRGQYSTILRGGLAETLALMAAYPTAPAGRGSTDSQLVDRIVRSLFDGNPGWTRWASCRDILPVLAEAAPDAMLESIDADLRSSSPAVVELFGQSTNHLSSGHLGNGLLWALETLAWSPEYIPRACLALAALEKHAAVGNRGSSPIGSLSEILNPWLPHTSASVEDRIRVMQAMAIKCPDVAFRVLLELLPRPNAVSTMTKVPRFRDWRDGWRRGVTNSELLQQVSECVSLLVGLAGAAADRWAALFERLGDIPHEARQKLISHFDALHLDSLSADVRATMAASLRKEVCRFRRKRLAPWDFSDSELGQLEVIVDRLQPIDPVARHSWLFKRWPIEVLEWHGRLAELESEVRQRRECAIREILESCGLDAVVELLPSAEDPGAVGLSLARLQGGAFDSTILPDMLDGHSPAVETFARGYAFARLQKEGWAWVNSFHTQKWTGAQIAALGLAFRPERETWEFVERQAEVVQLAYWKRVHSVLSGLPVADLVYAAGRLTEAGRPLAAVQCLAFGGTGVVDDPPLLLATLERAVCPDDNSQHDDPSVEFAHVAIRRLISHLEALAGIDESRLARIEWEFVRSFDDRDELPLHLSRSLASRTEHFVSLIRMAFRSEVEDADKSLTTIEAEESRTAARRAFGVLHQWKGLPGLQGESNRVDEDALRDWVEEVRKQCRDSGHLGVCDVQVGEVLSRSPEGGGGWPCVEVRDVLEDLNSDDVLRGFVMGTINQRGVVIKLPSEGGEAERNLAGKYLQYAKVCEVDWPRLAAALRQIARYYERDAQSEDQQLALRDLDHFLR